MIKTLAVVSAFAASMFVGVPSAEASTFLCTQKYDEDVIACEGNATCEVAADMAFVKCLQDLADGIDPL